MNIQLSTTGVTNLDGRCALLASQLELATLCQFQKKKLDNIKEFVDSMYDYDPRKGDDLMVYMSVRDRIVWGKYEINNDTQRKIDLEFILSMLQVAEPFVNLEVAIIEHDIGYGNRDDLAAPNNKDKDKNKAASRAPKGRLAAKISLLNKHVKAFNASAKRNDPRA